MVTPVRIGLIGCGNNMATHVRRLSAHPEVEIAGLADPSPGSIGRLVERQPSVAGLPTFSTAEELLRAERPDAVVISTPHAFHFDGIIIALEYGCHVLVEKPMVSTVAHAREVVARWRASGKVVSVSYQRRYQPTFRYMRRVVESGQIGDVQFVQALQNQNWYERQRAAQLWRIQREISGGGQLNDSGSHLIDILLYTVGQGIRSVYCQQQSFDLQVDVNSSMHLVFENGAFGSVAIVGHAPGIGGQVWEDITIYGTRGSIGYRQMGQPFQPTSPPTRTTALELRLHTGDQELPIGELPVGTDPDVAFVEAIRDRGAVESTPEDGLRVAELTEGAFESARLERSITVAELVNAQRQ
ncbi:MAG: Gfo/Idh/MocA family oxidoreductase [Chloroflexi bacterium]|nr:Gfo/Idh/MocA family oxidoreductase [Chloroflexota bacterium]